MGVKLGTKRTGGPYCNFFLLKKSSKSFLYLFNFDVV